MFLMYLFFIILFKAQWFKNSGKYDEVLECGEWFMKLWALLLSKADYNSERAVN